MSEENVEIVRKSVDAVNRGDIEEVLRFIDADVEYHSAIIGGAEGNLTEATTASASGSRSRQLALTSSTPS
jgi:ketosteroid isomerase-like protein